jgi:glycosyltransferase involved in cell wall biosynthesis
MKRVLAISYHYPPIGGAGAQRPAKMLRYLRERGYASVVLTGPGAESGRWAPTDESLAIDTQPDAVTRLTGPEPVPSTGWRKRGERWLGLSDPWARWWVRGVEEVGREALSDVDLLYAWMSPFESAEPTARIARRFDKPWVADLGDPWALDEMFVYPTRWHRRRDLHRMRILLRTADAVVMSTEEAVRRLRNRFPEFEGKRVVAIPNGFDASDFATPISERSDGKFRIVHAGYLHTALGLQLRRSKPLRRVLGGAVTGVDFLTRSHVFLVEAIDRLVARDPSARDVVELCLAGVLSPADRAVTGTSGVVRMLGYVPHDETLRLTRSAELLFLPMHELPDGVRAGIVPGKTYEYLATGRPILAAVPDGDAREILEEAGNALLCRPADIDCMVRALESELARFRAGLPAARPDPNVVERYEYRRLSASLAGVFDEVLAQRETSPGTGAAVAEVA